MRYYIIDGNNVIGKDRSLKSLQKKVPQQSREKLAFILDRYFGKKNYKVFLHLDGFAKEVIRTSKIKLVYSDNKTADDKIRRQIEHAKNPKLIIVVTSDRSLGEFAKVCSCTVIKSEEFLHTVNEENDKRSESEIQNEINDDEIKKLFGL